MTTHPLTSTPAPGTVRVAGIALKWLRFDKDANLERGKKLIHEAAANGAQIVVTSECFLDGYMADENTIPLRMFRELAEPVPDGQHFRQLSALAAELGIYLVVGMVERNCELFHNSAALIGPDGEHAGTYRKEMLCPEDQIRCTAGDGPKVFDTQYGRVGFRICYDRGFPEVVKATCDAGADFVILVSGGTYGEGNTKMIQSRARENGKYMIFVHPVHFLVAGPDGSILADLRFGGTGEPPPDGYFRHSLINSHAIVRGMVIGTEQIGTEIDENGVGYFDMPRVAAAAGTR